MIWAFKELADEHQRLLQRTDALPSNAGGDSVHMALDVTTSYTDICFKPIRERTSASSPSEKSRCPTRLSSHF